MAMKKNNRDYIAQMNKGMKQKLSMLLIACLLFTGYHGLTISGRAEQEEKEQTNEISVSGTQVKVQLLGEDIRRAAKEAIEKGDRVEGAALQGYSGDEDLQKEYAEIFSSEKEVYEIPLDSISEGLSESLAEEEAGLQVFVERDAKDLERLVRKESKESLLLYDGNSQLSQLFPETKQEETKSAVEKKEESGAEEVHASDSNIEKTERNTELTGSELITFLYKNKADHRISFQLSVDGNTYPKVVVSPKTQLFKSFLDKLKKEEKKPQVETTVLASTEAKESTAAESAETEATASVEESESESAASSVSLVSTEGSSEETTVLETTVVETAEAENAEETAETKEHTTEVTEETEATEETAAESKAAEAVKEKKENFTGFLQEVISHYEEFLGELETARFAQYSLNELGRKTQNVEIKDFVTIEVFYDEDAFDEDVVLEAKRLVKPEEEGKKEGEKLTEEQIKAMKDQAIYDDSDALDIRFVSKADRTKEVEPKVPVSVRLTFDKAAVPEDASADTVAIHHIVEEKDTGKVKMVETVVRAELEKKAEEQVEARKSAGDVAEQEGSTVDAQTIYSESLAKLEKESVASEQKEGITKEFIANSFSAYIVTWQCDPSVFYGIRFHYVDKNFKEIGPTVYKKVTEWTEQIGNNSGVKTIYYKSEKDAEGNKTYSGVALKSFPNFTLKEVGGQKKERAGAPYTAMPELKGIEVYYIDNEAFWWEYTHNGEQHSTLFTKNCAYTDFYFIYELKPDEINHHEKDISPNLVNEKFIKDNQDGTYDLTLTGQVKQQTTKQKLDILFVYDNTAVMATGFNFKEKDKKLSSDDYASKNDAKSTKVKKELSDFMKRMSDNKDVDARFALVTMDGDKGFNNVDETVKAKYDSDSSYFSTHDRFYKNSIAMLGGNDGDINIVGDYKGDKGGHLEWLSEAEDDDGKSHGFNVHDEAYNDTKNVYGFTDSSSNIIAKLNTLDEKNSTYRNRDSRTISGENYASAMKNVKVLMGQGGNYEVTAGGLTNDSATARSEAEKIVVFIAGGNPKFATIPEKEVYDDTHRYNNTDYYMIRRDYKEGWSYGNGYSINFPALNQARGELSKLTNVDAFYSIGVGNTDNWKYLNDFAMGQYYDEDGNHRTGENYDEKKHPDRREKALAENVRYKCYDGSTETNLHTAFQGIYQRVARNQVRNIKITDILTKYVQPVPQNKTALTGQLVKMNANLNGNFPDVEVAHVLSRQEMKDMGLEDFEVDASKGYDLDYGREVWKLTLTTKPADFSLPPGYDIRMVAKVEPTEEAKKSFESESGYTDEGEDRTDLNDIYMTYLHRGYHEDGEPDSKFNSSAHKHGLFTNEYADITYKTKKPDGSEGSPQTKEYNKPIISKGSLIIEKTFSGLEGTKLFDDSSGKITDFGKKVLKQLEFIVEVEEFRGLNNYGQKTYEITPLLKLNLKDDSWWTEQASFKDGVTSEVSGLDNLKHKVTLKIVQDSGKAPQLKITVDNLIPSKRYRVVEYCNKPYGAVEKIELSGSDYQLKGVSLNENPIISISQFGLKRLDRSESCKPDNVFKIENCYEKKENPKTITVKKVVTGIAKPAASSKEKFQFHLVIKKHDGGTGQSLSKAEKDSIINELKAKNANSTKFNISKASINLTSPKVIKEDTISFELEDGEWIQIPLKPNYRFQVYEKKSEGYGNAKIVPNWKGNSRTIQVETGQDDNHNEFTYMEALEDPYDGEIITFENPTNFTIPTGLTRDTTPYLLSIFGFVAMAGVYLTIKKKKRIEI